MRWSTDCERAVFLAHLEMWSCATGSLPVRHGELDFAVAWGGTTSNVEVPPCPRVSSPTCSVANQSGKRFIGRHRALRGSLSRSSREHDSIRLRGELLRIG